MPRAKRICGKPGCPAIADGRYCPEHNREYEQRRGTKGQRGYDRSYYAERKRYQPTVEAGQATCWRCGEPIPAGAAWNLGHNDDRTKIMGPEHPRCNFSAAGKSAHKYQ